MNAAKETVTVAELVKVARQEGLRVVGNVTGDEQEPQTRLGSLSRSAALERIASTPLEWLVQDVLSSVDYGTLAGPKGAGKSIALEDMAVSVALGEPWLGRFPTTQGTVLILTCEEHEARTWKRLDAIARSKGHEPEELEGAVFVHPIPFSAIRDIARLRAEVEAVRPVFVALDPAYKYMSDANARDIFNMGGVLTPIQVACQEHGAALLVGHHNNRRGSDASREERVSGSGILEWARVLITIEASPRRAGDDAAVLVSFEISGNSLDPIALRVKRTVRALEDGPNPDLEYAVEIVTEGAEARPGARVTTADRVRQVLGHGPEEGRTVAEISDRIGPVPVRGEEKFLKHDTIRAALNRALEDEVDNDQAAGSARRWWLVTPPGVTEGVMEL